MDTEDLLKRIESKEVKGLIVMDGEPSMKLPEDLEFLVVQEENLSELGEKAHVVIPSLTHAESSGTITSQDRRIQYVRNAVEPHIEMTNIEQIKEIMRIFGNTEIEVDVDEILENIGKEVPEYLHAHENINDDSYWPIGKSRVLYGDKFATEDGKAKLQPVYGNIMYRDCL